MIPWESKLRENLCTLHTEFYQIFRLKCNKLETSDIRETIIGGERRNNNKGAGFIYTKGVIEVVAKWKPCHCHVITIYNKSKNNNSTKTKSQRRNKHMERDKEKTCPRCEKADLIFESQPIEISGEAIGDFPGLGCPNCRYVCFDERTTTEIKNIISKLDICPIDPMNLVLLLLYSYEGPICGAISFMKEAFLLVQEKFNEFKIPALQPKFIPYYYGPYSFDIVESWYNLEELGLIRIEGKRSSPKECFWLTEDGREEAKEIFESLPEELQRELPAWRKGLDQLGNDILKDVYLRYPEYLDRSRIKDEVLPKRMHRRA